MSVTAYACKWANRYTGRPKNAQTFIRVLTFVSLVCAYTAGMREVGQEHEENAMKAPRLLSSVGWSACQIEHQHAALGALFTSCSRSVRVTRARAMARAALETLGRTRGISIVTITTPLTVEAVRASRRTRASRRRGTTEERAFVPEKAISRDTITILKRKQGNPVVLQNLAIV